MKIKSSLNKAKQVETRPNQNNIETMPSEDLALILNQQYQALMQAQQNILAVNQQLEKRRQQTKEIKVLPTTEPKP